VAGKPREHLDFGKKIAAQSSRYVAAKDIAQKIGVSSLALSRLCGALPVRFVISNDIVL